MSDTTAPQCPYGCGDLYPATSVFGTRWICASGRCGFHGPDDDNDGSKVRRLVAMPEPKRQHEDLLAHECYQLLELHGGEWSTGGLSWKPWGRSGKNEQGPSPTCVGANIYRWRPTPPKETRREATLAEVFAAKPDGRSCWAEHKQVSGPVRCEPTGAGRVQWFSRAIEDWAHLDFYPGMEKNWTIVSKEVPGEG